jgi:phosphohistidine swiveling domain-containing protein
MPEQLIGLPDAGDARDRVGGKAAVLGELAAQGWPVPPAFVVTADALAEPDLARVLAEAAARCGGDRFAVRSSGAAEDLPDASYAGLYETFLDVHIDGLAEAVRRCFAAAQADRVRSYHERRAHDPAQSTMAVLVQVMVNARAAGVAFTAHPVTGVRDQIVVTAVAGVGEPLVGGEQTGEEWTITGDARPRRTRPSSDGADVLGETQAGQVAAMAAGVAGHSDRPQDIEWAIDTSGKLWLLQARPMTALPEPVSFTAPGPGLWMRNFRLGEWLPEAVTVLFGTWLLPELEAGYLDGMHSCIGVRVPFRWALVHDWYYTASPIPSPRLLARVIARGRSRAVKTLWHALIHVGRDPVAADRAVLADLYRRWRDEQLPRYRTLIAQAESELPAASPARVTQLVTATAREAGQYMWYLAIVGGSAWKIEASLARFCRAHLAETIDRAGGVQVLLSGLPTTQPAPASPHAVQSLDWYHPVAAELPAIATDHNTVAAKHRQLATDREAARATCRTALAPGQRAEFDALLEVAQRYAAIREQQSRDLSLGWPVLRACASRLGEHLTERHVLLGPDDLHFCTRPEVDAAVSGQRSSLANSAADRRRTWEQHRRLLAPITIGRPPRLVGDVIDTAVRAARTGQAPEGAIVGHPASAGRATGPVRIIRQPQDFEAFADGDVLVAKATSPAWTPLFARAAAVVTDGGTLAAHASLVAREYGIPAVVGTGDATNRLHNGQLVTVDGNAGTVTPAAAVEHTNAQP